MTDIHNDWIRQSLTGLSMQLTKNLDAEATSLTVNQVSWYTSAGWAPSITLQSNLVSTYRQQNQAQEIMPSGLAVGNALLIGSIEPVTITSIGDVAADGSAEINISRGKTQKTPVGDTDIPLAEQRAFRAGQSVALLRYATPWNYMEAYLKGWALAIHAAFGIHSSLFTSSVIGKVSS